MSRVSIDVTPQEHQKLKAMAALQGKTIKEFVLSSTIGAIPPKSEEATALAELEELLDERMRRAKEKGFSKKSVDEIFTEGVAEAEAELNPDV